MKIFVRKKSGVLEDWSDDKLKTAIRKSSLRTDTVLGDGLLSKVVSTISNKVQSICGILRQSTIGVAEIHGIVESTLQKMCPEVGNAYTQYRNYILSHQSDIQDIWKKTKETLFIGDRENANYNSSLVSTKGSLIRGYLTKELYKRHYLSKDELQAIEDGYIYIHDLRDLLFGHFNCIREDGLITIRKNGKVKMIELRQLGVEYGLTDVRDSGIEIFSKRGFVALKGIMRRRTKRLETMYEIHTISNKKLSCTGDHRIPVLRYGKEMLVFAKDIQLGDKIFYTYDFPKPDAKPAVVDPNDDGETPNLESDGVSSVMVAKIVMSLEVSDVYDLETEDHYFNVDGFIVHNCCLFDMANVLKGGFVMSGIRYKEPKTVLSAMQVIGDVTLVATAQQYGGFTIPELDKILVPYAKKSYQKWKDGFLTKLTANDRKGVFSAEQLENAERYAWSMTDWEIRQGAQSIEMKLNTVPSSRGDTAFVTVSFGCVNPDDPDAAIQRKIADCILDTRMHGQGNGSPVLFPKLIYLYSEEQHKDPDQQTLFRKAIKCNSLAMYPDYISLDAGYTGEIYKKYGVALTSMGCRSFLSEWNDSEGNPRYVGRANVGVVSLNLPMIWKKSEGAEFWNDLNHYLDMMRAFLRKRYDAVAGNPCSTNPLCFCQGGIVGGNKRPDEKVGYDIVKSFTASFGITALNELNVLETGKELHESDRRFVNKVVDHINNYIEKAKKEDGYLYSLYGVPAESLAGTQVQQFRKKFGIVPKVSDREYFSNSFHCHVSANITPFEKQDNEFELFHKVNGGHIQYVHLDNPNNLEAIETIVKRGMKMGFYQGVNFTLAVCEDCGYRPRTFTEGMKCPVCGQSHFTVSVRICGYLGIFHSNGSSRLNDAKIAECADRVSM